jgi:sarcosine oxidase, subunit beta
MFGQFRFERMWARPPLKKKYDIVIIGAGVHGLATAYYLAKDGVRSVAVLEKGYLGSGNSGRNTAIIRANYRTPDGISFYRESLKLYEELSGALGYNVMFSQQGHLTLAHTDSAVNGLRVRAETNQALGVDSRMIYPGEVKRLVPALDASSRPRYPILAALYHPPGGIIRHDAVVWGYAREASRMGVEIHPHTGVVSLSKQNGTAYSIGTRRDDIQAGIIVNCTSGWSSTIARMLGVELPIITHPLQACVTESMKPLLDKVIVSSNLHVYISQTPRGEFVMGAEIDPYQSYSTRSTFPTLQMIASHAVELFPCLASVRILRQWAGVCDMTPDYSPIIGDVPQLKGFYLDVGWGTYGFKAGPVAGKCLAKFISSGKLPDLIRPFSLMRFYESNLVGEKAAAAVSH